MITLKYTSIDTLGNKGTDVYTYETLEAAKADMMEAIFDAGCSVVNPIVTDDTGKQYKMSISITKEHEDLDDKTTEMVAAKVASNEQYQAAFEQYGQALDALKKAGVSFELLNAIDVAVSERLMLTEEIASVIGTLQS